MAECPSVIRVPGDGAERALSLLPSLVPAPSRAESVEKCAFLMKRQTYTCCIGDTKMHFHDLTFS